jgi:hypothetical protein
VDDEAAFQQYVDGALRTFGIEADEVERAVMLGVWRIYRPETRAMLAVDLDRVEPEPELDLSRAPRP